MSLHQGISLIILSSHIFSVAVWWCLNPGIWSELILTEVTPTIDDLFQRTRALWTSFACSFKMVLVDAKNMFSGTIFSDFKNFSEAYQSSSKLHWRAWCEGVKIVFSKVGSPSSAGAAVVRLQKPLVGGTVRTETCMYRKSNWFENCLALLCRS